MSNKSRQLLLAKWYFCHKFTGEMFLLQVILGNNKKYLTNVPIYITSKIEKTQARRTIAAG
ncbi:hypothetical protein CPter291_2956 [Collimonas pratensis]|uniref:Uncharacterized protein n=1 Tax=Collimonas pratensis TaxID=279113 RepID=A0ABM5Z7Z2_9BURK|nr:hypothetical protein CPter291_2956 [Collimonas pratensis]